MGSGESRHLRGARIVCGLALAVVILAAGPAPQRVHSFDIQAAGRTVCSDGAVFVGESTAASSLNIVQTAEVWDDTGTTLLATGNSHTFTAVGETFTYIVPGSLTAGATVTLVVTNVPASNAPVGGTEGDAATAQVGDCSIAGVPTLPVWGMALLALALVAGGGVLLGRGTGSPWRSAVG